MESAMSSSSRRWVFGTALFIVAVITMTTLTVIAQAPPGEELLSRADATTDMDNRDRTERWR
jgi:hypothetical protein